MTIAEQKQIHLEKLDLWLTERSTFQLALLGMALAVPQGVACLLVPAALYGIAYTLFHLVLLFR